MKTKGYECRSAVCAGHRPPVADWVTRKTKTFLVWNLVRCTPDLQLHVRWKPFRYETQWDIHPTYSHVPHKWFFFLARKKCYKLPCMCTDLIRRLHGYPVARKENEGHACLMIYVLAHCSIHVSMVSLDVTCAWDEEHKLVPMLGWININRRCKTYMQPYWNRLMHPKKKKKNPTGIA